MNASWRLVVGVVAMAWPAAASAQMPRPPAEPPARVVLYGEGGVSLRTDPVQTHLADVWSGTGRLAVPIGKFAPFVSGALARVKTACTTPNCSNTETRFLGGLEYMPGGGGSGVYAGLGLGVRSYRGTQDLGHSFFIGLTLPGTPYIAPTFELRSEGYHDLNELLIIAAGLRFTVPRPAPPAPPAGS